MSTTVNHSDGIVTYIRPSRRWPQLHFRELWEYRELLYFLVWRDVKVRYKQTVLGVSWIVLQPMLTVLIFTIIFGNIARLPSEGLPYPVFAYAALLPWNFFASAVSRCGASLVSNQSLVTKVYFPRLLIPLASVLTFLPDLAISLIIFLLLMFAFGLVPGLALLSVPLLVLLLIATALGVGLWLAALNVRYRDVGYVIPFVVQIWMYVSPVVYGSSMVPERWRWLYSLNPMSGVINSFRWALLGHTESASNVTWLSMAVVLVALAAGMFFFWHVEDTFADVI